MCLFILAVLAVVVILVHNHQQLQSRLHTPYEEDDAQALIEQLEKETPYRPRKTSAAIDDEEI